MSAPIIIEHRKGYWVAVLQEDYLHICDRNYCAAMLLKQFEHWHGIKLENLGQARALNASLEADGGSPNQSLDLWVFKTNVEAHQELMGLFGERAVEDGLKLLVEKGFLLIRNNPAKRWDRTLQYLFVVHIVQAAVRDLPPVPTHDYKKTKPQKCDKHSADLRHAERISTIPQICDIQNADLPNGERKFAASIPHGCGSNTSENALRTHIDNTTTTAPPIAITATETFVVVDDICEEIPEYEVHTSSTRMSGGDSMTAISDMLPTTSEIPATASKSHDNEPGPPQAIAAKLAAMGVQTGIDTPAMSALRAAGVMETRRTRLGEIVARHGEKNVLDLCDAVAKGYVQVSSPAAYLVEALSKFKLVIPPAYLNDRRRAAERIETAARDKVITNNRRAAAATDAAEYKALEALWDALPAQERACIESEEQAAQLAACTNEMARRVALGVIGRGDLRRACITRMSNYKAMRARRAA